MKKADIPGIGEIVTDVDEACRAYESEDELALDIETSGLSPWKNQVAVVSLHGERTDVTSVLHVKGHIPDRLKALLSEPKYRHTGHNVVGFDALFLAVDGVDIFKPRWHDTLVGETAIIATGRRDVSVSLQASVARRLGTDLKKEIDHRTWMNPTLSVEQYTYCAGDVRYLHPLRHEQFEKASEHESVTRALELEMELLPVIMRMVLNGMPFDLNLLQEYLDYQTLVVERSTENLTAILGAKINLDSPVQVKRALENIGIRLDSTNAQVLEELKLMGGSTGEKIGELLDYRHARQRIKMYSSDWVAKFITDGYVHPRFWQCSTDTGRASSSDPNLQQIPKDMRWVFHAEPGFEVFSVDYSQIEVRVAAALGHDQAMLAQLEAEDIHSQIGSSVFGVPASEVTYNQRKLSKAISFCLLFGGGANTLYRYARLSGSHITLNEARVITNRFFGRYRGIANMREKAQATAARGGATVLRLPTGLRRVLTGDQLTATRILNTAVQGTAAAGLKFALLECKKRGLDAHLGAMVHDELVGGRAQAGQGKELAEQVQDAMIVGMKKVIDAPVKAETFWGEAWGKRPDGWAEINERELSA